MTSQRTALISIWQPCYKRGAHGFEFSTFFVVVLQVKLQLQSEVSLHTWLIVFPRRSGAGPLRTGMSLNWTAQTWHEFELDQLELA